MEATTTEGTAYSIGCKEDVLPSLYRHNWYILKFAHLLAFDLCVLVPVCSEQILQIAKNIQFFCA
jgi:hypothetical protein